MKRKQLSAICLFSTAAVLALLCIYMLAADRLSAPQAPVTEETVSVQLLPAEIETVELSPAETQKDPTLPADAVDIVSDGKRVVALASRYEAESLLLSYLEASAAANPGERFLSAEYGGEIFIAEASGEAPLYDMQTAFDLLFSEPSLVPVTVHAESVAYTQGEAPAPTVSEEPALAKGSRIVTQLGAGARTAVITPLTYVGEILLSTGEPRSETVAGSRASIIRNGAYRPKKTDGEPDDDEGEKGKDAPMQLHWPLRGSISSHFGFRNGKMHLGVDIPAKAGTKLTAPAEGVVIFCRPRGEYGFVIDIDHGGGFVSRLTHCDNVTVELNQRVFAGDTVATLASAAADGDTPHLHYELLIDGIPYNPCYYCE